MTLSALRMDAKRHSYLYMMAMMLAFLVLVVPAQAFSFGELFTIGTPLSGSRQLKLLAVQEGPLGLSGSIATVDIEMRRGSGRVFLDTFPLSQIDTQISTRFAKEIACKYNQDDCSNYDFIYTIRSNSGIIGGPSAGAAMSVITIASLENLRLRDDVAMTGTINSGGIIGPVSGIRFKIDAAAEAGLSKVLVPAGSMVQDRELGVNYAPEEYGRQLGIEVVEVADLDDALYHFTGQRIVERDLDIEIPEIYSETMSSVAEGLCDRNDDLRSASEAALGEDIPEEYADLIQDLTDAASRERERADLAMGTESYYAAASHCYGSNINHESILRLVSGEEGDDLLESLQDLAEEVQEFEMEIDELELETLSDFEVYMIMKERIADAKVFVENARDALVQEDILSTHRSMAQATERLYTSKVWEDFLGMGGRRFEIDDDALRASCSQKLSETQERIQYIQTMAPMQDFSEMQSDIDSARAERERGEYALCISRASRAKASANVFMNLATVRQDKLEDLVKSKLGAARNVILSEQERGNFPIMGYSYYEYADSLVDNDIRSAMIYAEYALELSWLDIYFEETSAPQRIPVDLTYILLVALGFVLGGIVMLSLVPRRRYRVSSRRLRRRLDRSLRSKR